MFAIKRFILVYELDKRKITFEFDKGIDYRKYNREILRMYKDKIVSRYVYDKEKDKFMSLKQLDKLICKECDKFERR